MACKVRLVVGLVLIALLGFGPASGRTPLAPRPGTGAIPASGSPDFELSTQKGCGRTQAVFEEGEWIEVKIKFNRKMNHDRDMAGLAVCVPGTTNYVVLERYIHLDNDPTITYRYMPPISTIGLYWLQLAVTGSSGLLGIVYCEFAVLPKVRFVMKTERGSGPEAVYFAGERMKFAGYAAHDADKVELMMPETPDGPVKTVYTWPDVKVSIQPAYFRDAPAAGAYLAQTRVWFRDAYYDVPCRFTVKPSGAPKVQTLAAADITPSSAVLESMIRSNGRETEAYFMCVDYPSSPNYFGASTISKVPASDEFQKVRITVSGLKPATTYNYMAVARNAAGKTEGSQLSFTTTSIKAGTADFLTIAPATDLPVAVTNEAVAVSTRSAQVNSYIDPKGGNAEVCFSCCAETSSDPDYFPTTSWSRNSSRAPFQSGVLLTGLKPGTRYKFAVRARNSKGQTVGKCLSFQTGHEKNQ